MSVACRCMEEDWAEDLGIKFNLRVFHSVCVNGFDERF